MNQPVSLRHLLSLSLFSGAGLALEVSLTRLLSTLYYPPFIFGVLALAVLGIAIGAALAAAIPVLRRPGRISLWMGCAGFVTLLSAPLIIWLATTPADVALIGVLILPYIVIGLTMATFFSAQSEHSQTLYAADLVGAGTGAVLVILILNAVGALNALFVIAVLMLLAAALYAPGRLTIAVAVIALILSGVQITGNMLTVDLSQINTPKPVQESLRDDGQILATRYDSFARTDLVDPPDDQPYRLYVDGAAASVMPPATDNDFLIGDIGLFAFATARPRTVFTIGGGGGLDVWFGLQVGAESITTVEANPQSVALTREYSTYNGDIYDQPGVRVLVDEGRSVLRREDQRYDLIFLSQVVTLTAERSGYALTENAVFTTEAFQDYWSHLSDEGYLALKLYDEPTLSRSLSLVMALFNQQGISDQDALTHVITLLDPETSPPTPLLIVRKTPFTSDEVTAIGRTAQRVGFATLFLPGLQADPPLDAVVNGVNTYQEVIDLSPLDLSAPTDNRPFFYQFERGIPAELQPVLLLVGIVSLLGLILLLGAQWRLRLPGFTGGILYFAATGVGFMLIEITLIQQTRLFIGHPTPAITVVLATLLVSGGIGSLWSRRLPLMRRLWLPALLCVLTIFLWLLIWSPLSTTLRGSPLAARLLIVILTVAPVGFWMGVPFAAGLTHVATLHPVYVPLAWGINGVMTIAGTVLGMTIALTAGYQTVLPGGALAYLLVMLAGLLLRRSQPHPAT